MYYSKRIQKKYGIAIVIALLSPSVVFAGEKPAAGNSVDQRFTSQLDGPLLFIKRYSYTGIHIYDTFYKWPAKDKGNGQGVGGI